MIDFDDEIKKYEFILTVEEVAQKVGVESTENDFLKILETINEKISNTKE